MDYQQMWSKIVVNGAPDHDATTAEPVNSTLQLLAYHSIYFW